MYVCQNLNSNCYPIYDMHHHNLFREKFWVFPWLTNALSQCKTLLARCIYKDNHRIALEDIEDNLRISDKIMMKMLEDEEEDQDKNDDDDEQDEEKDYDDQQHEEEEDHGDDEEDYDDQQDVATKIAKKKQTVRINPQVQVQ